MKKIISILLSAMLTASALTAVPITASAAQTDEESAKVIYFDVKSAGLEAEAMAEEEGVYCHIYRYDGWEFDDDDNYIYTEWYSEADLCDYNAQTGIATYNLQTGIDSGAVGLESISENNEWCVSFCIGNYWASDYCIETTTLLLNSTCFGDTVFVPDEPVPFSDEDDYTYGDEFDDTDMFYVNTVKVKWLNSSIGAPLYIDYDGHIMGDTLAYGETFVNLFIQSLMSVDEDFSPYEYAYNLLQDTDVESENFALFTSEVVMLLQSMEIITEDQADITVEVLTDLVTELQKIEKEQVGDSVYYYYPEKSDGEWLALILGCDSREYFLELPVTLGDCKVFGVGPVSFSLNPNLTEVVIPEPNYGISETAFLNCENLTAITIADSVENIGDYSIGYSLDVEKLAEDAIAATSLDELLETLSENLSEYFIKNEDLVIKGYAGSEAELYAESNGFKFIDLGNLQMGDVNADGEFTISDVTYVQRYIAEYTLAMTDEQYEVADADHNGEITISDATYMQRVLAEYFTFE